MTDEEKVTVLVFPGECAPGSLGAVDRVLAPVGGERRVGQRCGLVFETLGEVVCEKVSEREPEVDAFDTVFTHPDLLEEGPVEGTADVVGGPGVGLEAVGGEVESVVEVAFDLVESQRARVEDALCLGLLGGYP